MYPQLCVVLICCATTILGTPSRISKCSKITCPAVKATICVKIKQKNDTQVQTRYVMMSKCELKQIDCFHDVKVSVAPVKLCKATLLRDGGLNKDQNGKKTLAGETPGKPSMSSDSGSTSESDDSSDEHGPVKLLKYDDVNEGNKPLEETRVLEDNEEGTIAPIAGDVTDSTETLHELTREPGQEALEGDEDNRAHTDDEGACLQTCQTRDVMVCARCSHGIYRTFMSSCYMRMYQCQNPKERLELVSRHACLGSAPYLGEMARPSKNLVEPQDNDPVLNHIFAVQSEHQSGHS